MDNNQPTTISLGFLASRILDTPLMITKAKLDQILDVVGGRIGLDQTILIRPAAQSPYEAPDRSGTPSGIATIPIYGTLVHRSHGLSAMSGMTSYQSIREQFTSALDSSDIHTILLDIDSPGGEVAGVFDLVDTIYSARGAKPIIAMVNERGYSAAYALASAADRIYLSRTAGLGSVGVIMLHVDRSEANRKAGLTYTPIYAGSHKIDGSPNAPLSDKARASAQAVVDSMYDLFVSTVSRNINVPEGVIRNTQAGTYHGQSAIDIGLAHQVLSYQEVINTITTQHRKGGLITLMGKKTEDNDNKIDLKQDDDSKNAIDNKASDDKKGDIIKDPVITPEQLAKAISDDQISAAVKLERERCVSILEACAIAKTPDLAMDMIADGSSIEVTHKMIMTVLAERSKSTTITSAVNPAKSGQTNPLLADARRRAEAMKKG